MIKRNFIAGTECSRRRPTPTTFAHLRKWVEEEKRSVKITSITEMTNINQQLEQSAELYVSNIISRVIAQLIGKYGDGFVTLEATSDGKLKVEAGILAGGTVGLDAGTEEIGSVGLLAGTAAIGKLAAGTALIGKVQVAGSSKTVKQAVINVTGAGPHTIATPASGKKIKIVNIMFAVSGECDVVFYSDTVAISGAMPFGGTDEPRGMVHHFGDFPLETVVDKPFKIGGTAAINIDGYITYFEE